MRRPRLSSRAGAAKTKFQEAKHKRDLGGKFADKPGAGDDAPRQAASADWKASDVRREDVIRLRVTANPKRAGTRAHAHFAGYRDGMSVGDYIDAHPDGRRAAMSNLVYDVRRGYISFHAPPTAAAVRQAGPQRSAEWRDDPERWARAPVTPVETPRVREAAAVEPVRAATGLDVVVSAKNDAVSYYTGSGYSEINTPLRRGEMPEGTVGEYVLQLDDLTASQRTAADAVMWRGINKVGGFNDMPPPEEFADLGFSSLSGAAVVSRGFAGVTTGGAPTIFRVRVPAGTPAAFVSRSHTSEGQEEDNREALQDEAEFLMPRGTRFRHVGTSEEGVEIGGRPGRYRVIDLEIVV